MSNRLKLLRKKLGITLETLADRAGMTKSYVSKVERGLNTPSISAAMKLARALGVNVEELFADEQPAASLYSLVRRDERQSLVGDGQGPGYAALTNQVGQRNLLPFMIQPPTSFSDPTFKEHQGEEFLFVHQGQVEVDFINERVLLGQGDALHFNAQTPHRLRSVGDHPAQLLVVVQHAGE
ncbi:MAG TPA: DNA-binding protein [Pseudomonas sp.]|nr:DNA-binding protein [Pseudomonas sp.]